MWVWIRKHKKAVSTTKAAVNYTQQKAKTAYEKAVEAGTSSYNWVASKSKEAQNIAKNWTKALEENMKHVCTSVKYAGDTVSTFMKNVDWKKVTTGVAVTAGVALVVVATGGAAAPIIAGAAIGAGSGAVISGGMTAVQGGSIEEVAKAASDGFMWGAIGGSFSGGVTSLVNTAAANGSKVAASAVVGKGVDVVTDTSLDVAQTVTSGGKVTLGSVLVSAGTSLVLGSTGGGKADDVAGVVHGGSKNTRTIEINKKNVIQDDSLFNRNLVDNKGRSNSERMNNGLAPIGNDGKSVNLHHVNQKNDGDILEILQSEHQSNYKQLHQNTGALPSEINRKEFNQWRKEYWKQR